MSSLSIPSNNHNVKNDFLAKGLISFFCQLQTVGTDLDYRYETEIMQLEEKLKILESSMTDNKCLDIAIMQSCCQNCMVQEASW